MVILTGGRDDRPIVECLICGVAETQLVLTALSREAPARARVFEHLMERHGLSDTDIRNAGVRRDQAGWTIWNAQQHGDFMREHLRLAL